MLEFKEYKVELMIIKYMQKRIYYYIFNCSGLYMQMGVEK